MAPAKNSGTSPAAKKVSMPQRGDFGLRKAYPEKHNKTVPVIARKITTNIALLLSQKAILDLAKN